MCRLPPYHTDVVTANDKAADCGNDGYTGDLYCNACEITLETGEVIPATGDHANLEIRGAAEATYEADGYTGDTYCADCDTLIEEGTSIPKLEKPAEPDVPADSDGTSKSSTFELIFNFIKTIIEFLISVF